MSHEVVAYRRNVPTAELADEMGTPRVVASLIRGAFSPYKAVIYTAMDCMQMNAGVSGSGECDVFNQEQLRAALDSLPPDSGLGPERAFLQACIDYGDDVFICFY